MMEAQSSSKKVIWFKAKKYGLGWYPVTWQGWIILAIYLTVIIKSFILINMSSHSGSDTLITFAPIFIMTTVALLLICYKKGEIAKWRWGEK